MKKSRFPWKTVIIMAIIGLVACAAAWMLENNAQTAVASGLRISEVMADSEVGDSDWIEIENTSDSDIGLYGYALMSAAEPKKSYVFPNCTIEAGGFLVITADGSKEGGYHAPFKLSSGGSTIYLLNANGNTIDSVTVPGLGDNQVYALDENGSWQLSYTATPNAQNSITDTPEAISSQSAVESSGDLEITEVVTKNRTFFPDEDGEISDYVEIHNKSDEAVNLSGMYLSNQEQKPKRWAFPDVTLQPDEYLTVHMSGLDEVEDGHIHANFKLLSSGVSLYLTKSDGTVISSVTVPELQADQAYSRTESGWTTALAPSPNAANTVYGADAVASAETLYSVHISEIVASSSSSADWIEIVNTSDSAVDLSGWGLSDNASRPRKWQFPSGTVIQAGEYMCVFASSDTSTEVNAELLASSAYNVADFNLSASGEYSVVLAQSDGTIVDRVYVPQQYRDISYGRLGDSSDCLYLETMTPGSENRSESYLGRAQTPEFSVSGGLFTTGDVITVSISAPSDCRIYYTTDNTDPSESSALYTSPIQISEQTVLRARAYKDGCMPSYMETQTYIFDAKNGSGSVYTVSIVSDPDNLFSDESGILVAGTGSVANYDQEWEREAHVEIYDCGGNQITSQEVGMAQQGQTCRSEPQQCFKLIARSEYGDSLIRGHIFSNRDYDTAHAILIRNSSDDANKTRMRDSVLVTLAKDTSVLYQETEVCIVYLNGEYWGQYNIREAISPTLICQHEGWEGQEDSLDLIVKNDIVRQGSNESFTELLDYLTTHDPNTDEAYQVLDENIDIQNYIEYMAIEIFSGNTDPSNVKRYRNANADGKWRWVLYDIDWAFLQDTNSIARWLAPGGVGNNKRTDNTLFIAAMKNDTFKDRFLTYFGTQLATNMTTENILSMFQERYNLLMTVLPDHFERWDFSESKYNSALQILISYAQTRPTRLLQFLKYDSTLNLSESDMNRYFSDVMNIIGLTYDSIQPL